jgi:ABC-type Mn2+/Zn2+ transport system ATPase subunit
MTIPLAILDNVSVTLAGRQVLDSVSLELREGDFVMLRGANGAGKTTLLRCILGMVKPSAGTVRHEGGGGAAGYVPQVQRGALAMPLLVRDVVAIGRCAHLPFWGGLRATDRAAVGEAMQTVGIAHLASRPIRMLSGGEQQKMQLARVLAQQPRLLLLDEPTAHLDAASRHEFIALLAQVFETRSMAVLLVTHDEHAVADCGTRELTLCDGGLW